MVLQTDWRLTNQERYLNGVALIWRSYSPSNLNNDHDHCEFCGAKFMQSGADGSLAEGYSTQDGYRWTCKTCFDDFHARFGWSVIELNGR
jgi:hypothetical protein